MDGVFGIEVNVLYVWLVDYVILSWGWVVVFSDLLGFFVVLKRIRCCCCLYWCLLVEDWRYFLEYLCWLDYLYGFFYWGLKFYGFVLCGCGI